MEFGLYRQADPLNSVLKTVLLLEIKFLIRKEARVLFSWEKGGNVQLGLLFCSLFRAAPAAYGRSQGRA